MKVFVVLIDGFLGSEASPFKIEVNSEHIPKAGDYIYLDWSVLSKPTKDCDDLALEDLLEFYEKNPKRNLVCTSRSSDF